MFEQSLTLFILVLLSAFFSCVETAFVSISDIRIQYLIEKKQRGIRSVKKLKDNYQYLIITILICNNLVNITASAIATSLALTVFESNAIVIAVALTAIIILIFGEIVPKNIAIAHNEWIAIESAPIIRTLQFIFYPLIKVLELLTAKITKPLDTNEIKSVVSLGTELGEIEKEERIMINNIFRFGDLQAYNIMTDRTQIFSIPVNDDIHSVVECIVNQGYSRIPVYEDSSDNIIGILYAKDILKAAFSIEKIASLKEILRPPMIIPETMLVENLLKEFKRSKMHIAIVVDEHGGVSGLITIEDVLEEIVGDIYDETDKEEVLIRKIDETKSIVKGETEIEQINSVLKLGLSEREDYETISGFVLSKLRHIPEVGEELREGSFIIKVTKADQKRIIEMEIERINTSPNTDDIEEEADI